MTFQVELTALLISIPIALLCLFYHYLTQVLFYNDMTPLSVNVKHNFFKTFLYCLISPIRFHVIAIWTVVEMYKNRTK